MIMKVLVPGIALLLLMLGDDTHATKSNSYVVTFLTRNRLGMDMKIHVNILRSRGPVWVSANLLSPTNSSLHSTSARFNAGTAGTLALNIPSTMDPWPRDRGNYKIKVVGTGGLTFTNVSTVYFQAIYKSVYIQTDKAVYKPGQTVRFRAFGVYPDLKPVLSPMDIEIIDPRQNKISQWLGVSNPTGVYTGEMAMSDQPLLGDWTLKVNQNNTSQQLTFKVDKYVLPKFEVTLTLPPYALVNDTAFTGKVAARYTFGKPVKGTVLLTVKSTSWWGPKGTVQPTLQESLEINGETTFSIPIAQIKSIVRARSDLAFERLEVVANVTETLTGLTEGDSDNIQYYREGEMMSFVHSPTHFKPGMKFNAYLKITQRDGSPIANPTGWVSIKITVYSYRKVTMNTSNRSYANFIRPRRISLAQSDLRYIETPTVLETMMVTITDTGIIPFEIDIPFDAIRMSVEANYKQHKSRLTLYRGQSPTSSFTQIRVVTRNVTAGSNASFEITTTDHPRVIIYHILSNGFIVKSGVIAPDSSPARLSLLMTSAMAPHSRMVVYYVRSDGEIVADSITFKVAGPYVNKVAIAFDRTRASPGQSVNLEVTADAGSAVYFLAVDKSVRLLKTGNDITHKQVDSHLTRLGGYYDASFSWPIFRRDMDAKAVFRDAGMTVLTDALLYEYKSWPGISGGRGWAGGAKIAASDGAMAAGGMGGGAGAEIRVRRLFPETWIWTNATAGGNGVATISATVPDTITSWVASAFAMNPTSGLGVAPNMAELEAFMKFFVRLTLPYSVIRGEQLVLQADVFNYLSVDVQVNVTLKASDAYDNVIINTDGTTSPVSGQAMDRIVTVTSQNALAVYFPIIPKKLGNIILSVRAWSPLAGDVIERTLLVEPEGIPREYNTPILVDLKQSTTFSELVNIAFPTGTVPGSQRIRATVIGDLLGPTISGLDRLVRIPSGCGEQNMVNFAPNVYVAIYLTATSHLTTELERKIKTNILIGYQKELTYQHRDGSFSAFGESDPSGSTWLTAFVVKSFVEARPYAYIDENTINKAVTWLLKQQYPFGTFGEPGRVIHKGLQGGSATGERSLAAYVLIALVEASTMSNAPSTLQAAIDKTRGFLESELADTTDMYELAIMSYALALTKSTSASAALAKLDALATVKDGMRYWEKPLDITPGAPVLLWRRPRPAVNIEMTSYALMTYALNNNLASGLMVLKWLTSQRNPYGGFSSTQDTVVALKSLSEMAALIYTSDVDMTVTVADSAVPGSGFTKAFTVNTQNALVLQSVEVSSAIPQISITATGRGISLAEIAVFYNVEAEIQEPWFDLNISISRDSINSFTVNVCTRWLQVNSSGMAVLEIGVPSGFAADHESITNVSTLRRVEDGNRKLILYFDEITSDAMCVSVDKSRVAMVAGIQAVPVKIFDYYEPQHETTLMYESMILKNSNVCSVCGTNCGCTSNSGTSNSGTSNSGITNTGGNQPKKY